MEQEPETKRPTERLAGDDLLREWGFDPATIKSRPAPAPEAENLRDPKPGSGRELLMSIDRRTAEGRSRTRGPRRAWWLDPRYG